MKKYLLLLPIAFFFALVLPVKGQTISKTKQQGRFSARPLTFIENKGQITDQYGNTRTDVQYKTGSGGVSIFVGNGQLHYQFSRAQPKTVADVTAMQHLPFRGRGLIDTTPTMYDMYRLDMTLEGANPQAQAIAADKQAYYENYHTAALHDSSATAAAYGKITYKDIYPNIDWVLYIKDNRLEYDFIVRPGGNVNDIKIKYGGATDIAHTEGAIKVTTPMGDISEQKLYAYEQSTGKPVAADFKYKNKTIGFSLLTDYDSRLTTIVIDPELAWGSYFGGVSADEAFGTACDNAGNVYITGFTRSLSDIATTGSYLTVYQGGDDVFLAKFNGANGSLFWATYYGGNYQDWGYGAACDSAGNVYITGITTSTVGIATPGSYQTIGGGYEDGFLAKFSGTGTLQWATYYGAHGEARGVACDPMGNVYVCGYSGDTIGIATPGCYQDTLAGGVDVCLAKFNSSGAIIWGTYYGGSGDDVAYVVSCDMLGNVYIGGSTEGSTNMGTPGCYHDTSGGGTDCLIAKFTTSGNLLWSTYYGGSGGDGVEGIICDSALNVYASGITNSPNGIATAGCYQSAYNGAYNDVFLVKFNDTGAIQWGTYFGGGGDNECGGVAYDGRDVYLAGFTVSTDSIATPGAYQVVNNGGDDAFLARFDIDGNRLWATYYGGSNNDVVYGVSCDPVGNVFIGGATASTNGIATSGTYQTVYNDSSDAFIAKFDTATVNAITIIQKPTTDIYLYPNPNNGNFIVNGTFTNMVNTVAVDIINVTGEVIYSNTTALQNGKLLQKINLNAKPGTYILRVTEAESTETRAFTVR